MTHCPLWPAMVRNITEIISRSAGIILCGRYCLCYVKIYKNDFTLSLSLLLFFNLSVSKCLSYINSMRHRLSFFPSI